MPRSTSCPASTIKPATENPPTSSLYTQLPRPSLLFRVNIRLDLVFPLTVLAILTVLPVEMVNLHGHEGTGVRATVVAFVLVEVPALVARGVALDTHWFAWLVLGAVAVSQSQAVD